MPPTPCCARHIRKNRLHMTASTPSHSVAKCTQDEEMRSRQDCALELRPRPSLQSNLRCHVERREVLGPTNSLPALVNHDGASLSTLQPKQVGHTISQLASAPLVSRAAMLDRAGSQDWSNIFAATPSPLQVLPFFLSLPRPTSSNALGQESPGQSVIMMLVRTSRRSTAESCGSREPLRQDASPHRERTTATKSRGCMISGHVEQGGEVLLLTSLTCLALTTLFTLHGSNSAQCA